MGDGGHHEGVFHVPRSPRFGHGLWHGRLGGEERSGQVAGALGAGHHGVGEAHAEALLQAND